MNIALAIQTIKFLLALIRLCEGIVQKVRESQKASDLLVIDKACGLYAEAETVEAKINEVQKIKKGFD